MDGVESRLKKRSLPELLVHKFLNELESGEKPVFSQSVEPVPHKGCLLGKESRFTTLENGLLGSLPPQNQIRQSPQRIRLRPWSRYRASHC